MNLQQHKDLKLNQMFFWETSYAGVFEQEVQNEFFYV